jgi:hypothetical protein
MRDDGSLHRAGRKRGAQRQHEEREHEALGFTLRVIYTYDGEHERRRRRVGTSLGAVLAREAHGLDDLRPRNGRGGPSSGIEIGGQRVLQEVPLRGEEELVGAGARDRHRPEIAQPLLLARLA